MNNWPGGFWSEARSEERAYPLRYVSDERQSRSPKAPWPFRRQNRKRGGPSLANFCVPHLRSESVPNHLLERCYGSAFVAPRSHSLGYARSSRLEIVSNLGLPVAHIISLRTLRMRKNSDWKLFSKNAEDEFQTIRARGRLDRGRFFGPRIPLSPHAGEWTALFYSEDSKTGNGGSLLERGDNDGSLSDARARAASCRNNRDGFLNGLSPVGLVGDFSICVKDQGESFSKISFGLGESFALGVGAGNFLDAAEIPLSLLKVNGGKLSDHGFSVI